MPFIYYASVNPYFLIVLKFEMQYHIHTLRYYSTLHHCHYMIFIQTSIDFDPPKPVHHLLVVCPKNSRFLVNFNLINLKVAFDTSMFGRIIYQNKQQNQI